MWQKRLRENYDNDFEQWMAYAETYDLHNRLGYATPEDAWEHNPIIQGSTDPQDFKVVSK